MFSLKLTITTFAALSAIGLVAATPTGIVDRSDWKDKYGWDGKVTTPAQLDTLNASKPTPGSSKHAALGPC
ncbi:hypothetical protein FRC07_008571 [Ceratobasidium sp. 392]|nr:hypothetical protein FRC07_008571 [Ceratobasidium sp. 392]